MPFTNVIVNKNESKVEKGSNNKFENEILV